MSDFNDQGFGSGPPPLPGGTPPPPPPPPGGYTPPPPPAPGGYEQPQMPPPPGGGFSTQPNQGGGSLPPPPGGYQAYQPGGMPGGGGVADISTALNWTVKKFQEHLVPFLSLSGVIFAVNLIGGIISTKLAESAVNTIEIDQTTGQLTSSSNFWGGIVGSILLSMVLALIVAFLNIGLLRAALRTTRGETPSFNDLTSGENVGKYIITAIVVGILTAIGLVLCIIPGLLVSFFLAFAATHSLDKGADVGSAISWSFDAVKRSWVAVLVLVLITLAAGIISAVLGGLASVVVSAVIGLFLAPFGALLNANLYRQMGSEPIAA